MRRAGTSNLSPYIAVLGFVLTAACAGGGGGGTSPAPASGAAGSTSAAPTTTTSGPVTDCTSGCLGSPAFSDTGIATGPVAAPLPASFGSAPGQVATSTTSTFDGSTGGYTNNLTFPLISTTLKAASPGMSSVTSPDATLTVSTSANSTTYQIVVPSVNWNATGKSNENIVQNLEEVTSGFSYVAMGIWGRWGQTGGNSTSFQSVTAFSLGYETPASAMPSTGSANFAGLAQAFVYKPGGTDITSTYVEGKANIAVNFSSGQITGTATQMQYWTGAPYGNSPGYQPWNDVSLNGNIAAGTNRFNGTTVVTSAPGTPFSLAGSATGNINGAFYGPSAQNIGAVWSLSDGAKSAIGVLSGKQ